MANQIHLEILKQGKNAWNEWREKAPTVAPDLSKANLLGMDLSGVNLYGVDLHDANLNLANLRNANLRKANLRWTSLSRANLQDADLRNANGLTEGQIVNAILNEGTKLPEHLQSLRK